MTSFAEAPATRDEIDLLLAGRGVVASSFFQVVGGSVVDSTSHQPLSRPPGSRGDVTIEDALVRTSFRSRETGTFETRLTLIDAVHDAAGVAVKFRLSGWDEIGYVAVGFTGQDNTFHHVKISNPSQLDDTFVCWAFDDLSYLLQNQFKPFTSSVTASDVRIWVKGQPSENGGVVDAPWGGAWSAPKEQPRPAFVPRDAAVLLDKILTNAVPYPSTNARVARSLLDEGILELRNGHRFPWPDDAPAPSGVDADPSHAYKFHALDHVLNLLAFARAEDRTDLVRHAVQMCRTWLRHFGRGVHPNMKYLWYDHGTAERMTALTSAVLAAQIHLPGSPVDDLVDAVREHALLLESETFYAAHQPSRYHNHACFQDIALVLAGSVFVSAEADRWRSTGERRLREQLHVLVKREAGYSVFVENSANYQQAMPHVISSALNYDLGESYHDLVKDVCHELESFTALLTYPDRRVPATGDSICTSNADARATEPVVRHELVVLPEAGYAVCHGTDGGSPFTWMMLTTSLSATHKHADNTSLLLHFDGIEWLTDPGFYTYDMADPIAAYHRGPWAHSQLVVPDAVLDLQPGTAWLRAAETEAGVRLEGGHRSFVGAEVERRVVAKRDVLDVLVVDRFDSDTFTDGVLVMHLGDGIEIEGVGRELVLRHDRSDRSVRISLPKTADPVVVSGWNGSAESSSVIATGFGRQVDSTSVHVAVTRGQTMTWRIRAGA